LNSNSCGGCVDRCPTDALAMSDSETWMLNLDRCIGCGVCATGCDFEAITLFERVGVPPPPPDQKALLEAVKAGQG
jgi:ferredoxin